MVKKSTCEEFGGIAVAAHWLFRHSSFRITPAFLALGAERITFPPQYSMCVWQFLRIA